MAIFYSNDENDPAVVTRVRDWLLSPPKEVKQELQRTKQNLDDLLVETKYLKSQLNTNDNSQYSR